MSITLTVLSGYSSDPAELTGLASLTADLIQEGTKTKNSRQIRRDVFGMGGSLTAAASQDYTSITARGLSEYAPRLIDLVADVAMNPTIPEEEVAILKQQHLQQAQQQKASPQFVANRTFRSALFGNHPYARTSETEASLNGMDRAKLVAFHRDHYRPNNAFLLIVGAMEPEAAIAAAEKAFGAWAKADVPAPAFTAPPPLTGQKVFFVQRPNSIQSSIALGNIAVEAQRPALVRADAGQHDLRRRVQLAHRAEHPRGEGLHLLAAVGADRLRRRRLLPLRRRRPQRGHRRDAHGSVQGDRQAAR